MGRPSAGRRLPEHRASCRLGEGPPRRGGPLNLALFGVGLAASAIAGAWLVRWIAWRQWRAHQATLAALGAPGDAIAPRACATFTGTLVDLDDPASTGIAVVVVSPGELEAGVPRSRTTCSWGRAGVRVGSTTFAIAGSMHVARGSQERAGDRETVVEYDASLNPPSNWDSIAVRKLAFGDRVRARGELRDGELAAAELDGERVVAVAHDPPPPGRGVVVGGAIAGIACWLIACAVIWLASQPWTPDPDDD